MGETNNFTNASLSVSNKTGNKVDAKLVGPLVAAVGVVLIILGIVVVQAIRGFRNKRRKVYHVSDKVLKQGIIAKKQVIQSETAIQNDFAEDELVHGLHYQHSTENLISEDDVDYTTFTSQPTATQNDAGTELPGASKPTAASGEEESSLCKEPSDDEMIGKQEISEEHFIPRANPLLQHLKKSNKIASLMEDSGLTSSITSGSTTEITDEELILIGTAIKSCPHFGRESPDCSTEYDRDEPYETISYPALTQTDDTTQAKTSTSFHLQEISSASEMSSAADNFYQFSAENMEDIPCTEAIAVNRKDLWVLEDVVSEDVIIIDN